MDNVTHTLIGVTLGTLASRGDVPPRSQAVLVAVIASNLPDLDFVTKIFYGGSNLGYLMQHRGWSHTLLLSPLLAVFSLWILKWILGRKVGDPGGEYSKDERRRMRRRGRGKLFKIAWASVLLHLFADYWNDYGIHPFSPFSNAWVYGDFMFIVEPALWIAILPLIYFGFPHRWVRTLALILGVAGCAVALFGPQGGLISFLFLTFWAAFLFYVEQRMSHRLPRGAPAAIAACFVLLVFKLGSMSAHSRVSKNLADQLPGTTVLETSLSPFPTNPFLWRTLVATLGPNQSYAVRLGTVSVIPAFRAPLGEFYGIKTERLAPLVPTTLTSGNGVHWVGEFRGSALDLARLAFQSCDFSTFLKFARFPFWIEEPGRVIVGDLRYDHEKGLGFAKIVASTKEGEYCSSYQAPWLPPLRFPMPGP